MHVSQKSVENEQLRMLANDLLFVISIKPSDKLELFDIYKISDHLSKIIL